MSLDRFLPKTKETSVSLALAILNRIAPRIIDHSVFIGERIALARAWCLHLALQRYIADKETCSGEWSEEKEEKIFEALVTYASKIIERAILPEKE